MSIDHIVDAGYVVIEPLDDPLEQPTWLPAASNDLLAYATPILGPLTTLIIHRMAWYFAAGDTWHQFDLDELGKLLRRRRRPHQQPPHPVLRPHRPIRVRPTRPQDTQAAHPPDDPAAVPATRRPAPQPSLRQLPVHHPMNETHPGDRAPTPTSTKKTRINPTPTASFCPAVRSHANVRIRRQPARNPFVPATPHETSTSHPTTPRTSPSPCHVASTRKVPPTSRRTRLTRHRWWPITRHTGCGDDVTCDARSSHAHPHPDGARTPSDARSQDRDAASGTPPRSYDLSTGTSPDQPVHQALTPDRSPKPRPLPGPPNGVTHVRHPPRPLRHQRRPRIGLARRAVPLMVESRQHEQRRPLLDPSGTRPARRAIPAVPPAGHGRPPSGHQQ